MAGEWDSILFSMWSVHRPLFSLRPRPGTRLFQWGLTAFFFLSFSDGSLVAITLKGFSTEGDALLENSQNNRKAGRKTCRLWKNILLLTYLGVILHQFARRKARSCW
jgi:hypothetical protein